MCVLEEVDLQAIKQEGRAAWLTGEVDVVEEGSCRLAENELGLHRAQCRGEAKGEERRHQRVALFTTFGLVDAVRGSITIGPEQLGRGAVKQPDERQCAAGIRDAVEGCKHCLSADEVEGTDPVDRQHCERRVPVTLGVEGVGKGFGAGTGGQRVLMRPGGLVKGSRELLRERTRDEAAQEVADNDAPHPASGFANSDDAAEAEAAEVGNRARASSTAKAAGSSSKGRRISAV